MRNTAVRLVVLAALLVPALQFLSPLPGIAEPADASNILHGFRAPFVGAAAVSTHSGHTGPSEWARDYTLVPGSAETPAWDGTVISAADGIVLFAGEYQFNNCQVPGLPSSVTSTVVIVEHFVPFGASAVSTRYFSVYEHLRSWSVSKGDVVSAGDTLGQVGNRGCSTGTHLHFALYVDANSPPRWGDWARGNGTYSVDFDQIVGFGPGWACIFPVSDIYCGPEGPPVEADPDDDRAIEVGQTLHGMIDHWNDIDIYNLRAAGGLKSRSRWSALEV